MKQVVEVQVLFFCGLILRGVNIDDEVFLKTNTTLTKAVQNFIIKTNRFSEIENKD